MVYTYDPNRSPVPEQWLKLDETERIGLVMEYHARSDADLPNPVLHATFHAVVENQLAESISEVRTSFDRLMSEGLDRHEAIHAIASVLVSHVHGILGSDSAASDLNKAYFQELQELTADNWRNES